VSAREHPEETIPDDVADPGPDPEVAALLREAPALAPRAGDLERVIAALRAVPLPGDARSPALRHEVGSDAKLPTLRHGRGPIAPGLLRFAVAAAALAAFTGLLSVALVPAGASLVYAPRLFARAGVLEPRDTSWATPWAIPGVDRTPPAADLGGVLGADALDAEGRGLSAAAKARLLEGGILWRPATELVAPGAGAATPGAPGAGASAAAPGASGAGASAAPPGASGAGASAAPHGASVAGVGSRVPVLVTVDQAVARLSRALASVESDLEWFEVGPEATLLLEDLRAALVRDRRAAPLRSREAYALALDIVETGRALLADARVDGVAPGGLERAGPTPSPEGSRVESLPTAQSGAARLAPPTVTGDTTTGAGATSGTASGSSSGASIASAPDPATRPSHVAAEVALVRAAAGPAVSPVTGLLEDYGAFRGLSTTGPARALTWLARPRLALDRRDHAAAALALLHALCAAPPYGVAEHPLARYERIRARQAFFEGAPVDWAPERLLPAVRALVGEEMTLAHTDPDGPLAQALARLAPPSIEGPLGAVPQASLLGWRWSAAARATAALTRPGRLLGSGLDLLAAEGFPGARDLLVAEAGARIPDLDARLLVLARDLESEEQAAGGEGADLGRLMSLVRKEIGRAATPANAGEKKPARDAAADAARLTNPPASIGEALRKVAASNRARAARRDRALGQALATFDLAHMTVAPRFDASMPAAAGGARPQGLSPSPVARPVAVVIEPVPMAFARLAGIARGVAEALAEGPDFASRRAQVLDLRSTADLLDRTAEGDPEAALALGEGPAGAALSLEGHSRLVSVRTIDVVLGTDGAPATFQQRVVLGPVEVLALVPRRDTAQGWMLARGAGLAAFEVASERPLTPRSGALRAGTLPTPPWLRDWSAP